MQLESPDVAPRQQVEQCIKEWREAREQRLAAEKVARKLKEAEDFYRGFLLEAFKMQKLEGMIIDGRSTGLTTKPMATVSNKEELLAYIKATGQLELLQFRLSTAAVDERNENGVSVPGTEYIDIYDLFDRKV